MPIKEHKASDYLQTPEDIAAYLNAAIEEADDDPRLPIMAIRNVAQAQQDETPEGARRQTAIFSIKGKNT